MGVGERGVKRLDAETRRVFGEAVGAHDGDRAEAPDVAVVEVAAVVEREVQSGVGSLGVREGAAREEKGAGEARLHYKVIAPPCGASHLRSEFRGSGILIAPPCGASHLRSEF